MIGIYFVIEFYVVFLFKTSNWLDIEPIFFSILQRCSSYFCRVNTFFPSNFSMCANVLSVLLLFVMMYERTKLFPPPRFFDVINFFLFRILIETQFTSYFICNLVFGINSEQKPVFFPYCIQFEPYESLQTFATVELFMDEWRWWTLAPRKLCLVVIWKQKRNTHTFIQHTTLDDVSRHFNTPAVGCIQSSSFTYFTYSINCR